MTSAMAGGPSILGTTGWSPSWMVVDSGCSTTGHRLQLGDPIEASLMSIPTLLDARSSTTRHRLHLLVPPITAFGGDRRRARSPRFTPVGTHPYLLVPASPLVGCSSANRGLQLPSRPVPAPPDWGRNFLPGRLQLPTPSSTIAPLGRAMTPRIARVRSRSSAPRRGRSPRGWEAGLRLALGAGGRRSVRRRVEERAAER